MCFFYCADAGPGGGVNVFLPTKKLQSSMRFMERISFWSWKEMPLKVRWQSAIFARLCRLASLAICTESETLLNTVKTEKFACDGHQYCAPGFSCSYYDASLVEAFLNFIESRQDIPFDRKSAMKALETHGKHIYRPLYRSGNDYSALFTNAIVVQPRTRQFIIVDNCRWMHSATQQINVHGHQREMWVAFAGRTNLV